MITEDELTRRKWGKYPALGHILGKQKIRGDHFGLSSVSDNVFSWLNRLAEVAIIAREGRGNVVKSADPKFARRIPEDLTLLAEELRAAGHFFAEHADMVCSLRAEFLEESARRQFDEELRKKGEGQSS